MRARRGRVLSALEEKLRQIGTDATCVENVKLFVEGMQFI